jgi:hypothetical protein
MLFFGNIERMVLPNLHQKDSNIIRLELFGRSLSFSRANFGFHADSLYELTQRNDSLLSG